jgi:acyl-CoA thioester hydrolase
MASNIRSAKRLTLKELALLPITNEAAIDEAFLDSNRHMNVSWYWHLFNQSTEGMQKWLGFDWAKIDEHGGGLFILEGHIRYLAEVLVGQHVTVRTRLIARSAKRIQYLHFMFNDDNQTLAATYEEVQSHMDMKSRRMAPYPDSIAKSFDKALAEHEALDWDPSVCGVMRS